MIQAQILADSLSPHKDRLITFKVTFPRYILAEVNTHRAFSRNSASSRAIPFKKMLQMVRDNPFTPIAWQKDHKGMQGNDYHTDHSAIKGNEDIWLRARDRAMDEAYNLHGVDGYVTKQLCNRLLEPFMWHTAIITSSEKGLENFFNLRCPQYFDSLDNGPYKSKKDFCKNRLAEPDDLGTVDWLKINKGQADIHIMALAEAMWDARNESTPKQLQAGEWHLPMSDNIDRSELVETLYRLNGGSTLIKESTVDQAIREVCSSRVARISYQTLGENPEINFEKDLKLFNRLNSMWHASPMEHVAEAQRDSNRYANFRGFEQLRTKLEKLRR